MRQGTRKLAQTPWLLKKKGPRNEVDPFSRIAKGLSCLLQLFTFSFSISSLSKGTSATLEMDSSNADNSTFNGTLIAATNSTPANVPRDGSTTESMVGNNLSLIQELQAAYQELGRSYRAHLSANAGSGERMADVVNSSTETMIPMESYNSNADNSTFSGTHNAATNSTPANVPRDGSTTESMVDSILSLIQEVQVAYQELGHSYRALISANAASGERMEDVVNSSTQALIPEREGDLEEDEDEDEDEDDGQDLNTENTFSEALLELHEHINVGLRVRAFYLSIKLHKYELPKLTCLESKEHCCLCLVDYCDGEELAKIDCGHIYHVDCIKEWIKLKNSCPICKRDALAILT